MKALALILALTIPHAYHAAPGGDDSTIVIQRDPTGTPTGWRSFTSNPVWFVTDPGFCVQRVAGLVPGWTYALYQVLPRTQLAGMILCGRSGEIEFVTPGQAVFCVFRVEVESTR